ncbi:MAG: hypothetical protein NT051_06540 [Candidatus Micrarchaeota archaeon]|nr:hypothetical protein [Candidatus Micrarchaeota archaeon]
MDKTVVSMRMDKEIWKSAKKYAIDKDLTVSQLMENAIVHEMRRK